MAKRRTKNEALSPRSLSHRAKYPQLRKILGMAEESEKEHNYEQALNHKLHSLVKMYMQGNFVCPEPHATQLPTGTTEAVHKVT